MKETIEASWMEELEPEFKKPYFSELEQFVENAYSTANVFPPKEKIFEAFRRTPFHKVKAVILGQDPYHEPGQAQGLCFYVPADVKPPPSLVNIFKELGKKADLLSWANQGVLLMNATLTVEAHKAASHQKKGWETFTDAIIGALSKKRENIVFILWGAYARSKIKLIDTTRHLVLESAHPSPLSAHRGFFGSDPFSKTNEYLAGKKIPPIEW